MSNFNICDYEKGVYVLKTLKLISFAFLMSFMIMSCSDKATSPSDDYNFTVITEPQPLNLIIETYKDDSLIDTVRIDTMIHERPPDGLYYWAEYLTNQKVFNLRFYQYPVPEFDLYLEFESKSFKKGNFSLYQNISPHYLYYTNPVLDSLYDVDNGNFLIEEIKHFENTEGHYFISGEINVKFKKLENENYTTRVKIIYENMEIYVKTYE